MYKNIGENAGKNVAKGIEQFKDTLNNLLKRTGNFLKNVPSKAMGFMKDLYNKGKDAIGNIGKEEIKRLPSGQPREPINLVNENDKEKNTFASSLKLGNWISENYTREQAEDAQRFSDNPKELLEKMSLSEQHGVRQTSDTMHEM